MAMPSESGSAISETRAPETTSARSVLPKDEDAEGAAT
jgi:hypothetical protein